MPVTFHQIAANTATVTVQIANVGPVTIIYYPNKVTDAYIAELNAGSIDDNHLLIDLIKSWDIYEDDDFTVMFPIERISEFGNLFKVQVSMAIARDIRPEAIAPQLNGHS